MDQTLLGLQQSLFKHFKKWIIQESVATWKNMVGNGSIGKETPHLQVILGEFENNRFEVLE